MKVAFDLITGVMLGIENVEDEDATFWVIDLFIVRILLMWERK